MVKPAISLLVQSRHELQKKESSNEIYRTKNYYSNGQSVIKHVHSNSDQTPSSVTCPHVIEGS